MFDKKPYEVDVTNCGNSVTSSTAMPLVCGPKRGEQIARILIV